ncbi:MAG: adenylyl-sulfate kinase [Desulfovibrionaceae bacterium]|nr:adenylyl-sulfate kinase [Desulfovibrionaceae bacterium]
MQKVFWMTGLSGAGKTSLARTTVAKLAQLGISAVILDGDDMRQGLCRDLGFSTEDRGENLRRSAEVAKLIASKTSSHCICAFITPLEEFRQKVRQIIPAASLRFVFVDASLETCIKRDPKGNYRKVQDGLLKGYTGVGAPYEAPSNPDLHLVTDRETLDESVEKFLAFILAETKKI